MRYIFETKWNSSRLPLCIFGIAFVLFAHVSGNALAFGQSIFAAADKIPSNGEVRGVAMVATTLACVIHSISRRAGIWLSNILAFLKVIILVVTIAIGFCAYHGIFGEQDTTDLSPEASFKNVTASPYSFANGFLEILFAYAGWNQVNMVCLPDISSEHSSNKYMKVLSEVKDPRKTFKKALPAAVILVFSLYMLLNVVYVSHDAFRWM